MVGGTGRGGGRGRGAGFRLQSHAFGVHVERGPRRAVVLVFAGGEFTGHGDLGALADDLGELRCAAEVRDGIPGGGPAIAVAGVNGDAEGQDVVPRRLPEF